MDTGRLPCEDDMRRGCVGGMSRGRVWETEEEFAGKATGNDGRGSHTFAIVELKVFQGFSTLSRGKKLKAIFSGIKNTKNYRTTASPSGLKGSLRDYGRMMRSHIYARDIYAF